MKKLFRTVMVLSMASLTVLTSCKKDDKSDVADATIDINAKVDGIAINDGAHVLTGKTVKFTIVSTGNSDNKLKSISMTSTASSNALLSKNLSGTSSTDTPSFTVTTTGDISFTVSLTSEKGTVTKSFKVVGTVPGNPVESSPNAMPLYAQQNGAGSNNNFMSLTDFTQYNTTNFTISNVDLCFYFGQTNKASLTGPQDGTMQGLYSGLTWTGAHTTMIAKTTLTETDFNNVIADNSDNAIVAANATATYGSATNNLAVGNVLIYKTQGNKLGLILITSITGSNSNDGVVEFRLVYQP